MGRRAKIFAYSVITAGSAVFLLSLSRWNQADRVEFWTLLVLSAVASQVKVRFPGFAGTFTASLFVSFICLLELSLGEAAVIALASSAVQTFWKARTRPSSLKLLFNFAALSITVCGSADVYRLLQEHAAWLGAPGQLGSLAAVYFFLNTAPVALIVALTGGGVRNSLRGWRDTYASMWPFYFAGAALAGLLHYSAGVWGWQVTVLALPLLYLVERSYSIFFGRLEDSKRHLDEMAALQMRSIRTLALAVEAKDDTTHTHLHRVQTYAMEIGRELGLSAEELLALQAASILHDVGKLAVPEHIISKPGKLNAEEFEKMKIHTVVGAEIVEGMEFPYPVAPIVRAHHEKWNGMGYPYGLKETAIPIGARILSAVDCLDALATDRQYRRALPLDKAMDIVIADSGKAFDPKVVEVLSRRYRELEALAHSTLASVKVQAFSVNDRVALGASPDAGLEVSTRISDRASVFAGISRVRSEVHRIVGRLADIPAASRWDYLSMALSMELRDVIPHHGVAVYQKRADKIVALGASGEDGDLLRKLSVPEGQGFVGWVAENRKPILNGNPSVEPVSWERPVTLRAGLAVPMLDGDSVRGVLALYHRSADSFCHDHLHILEMLGPLFVSALDLSELQVPVVN